MVVEDGNGQNGEAAEEDGLTGEHSGQVSQKSSLSRSQKSLLSRNKTEELEEKIEKETEEVIFQELGKTGDEAKRSTLLYISLYEVLHTGVLHLPDDTLYSAFVCLPMIARSAGWPLTMTAIALKIFMLTLFCISMQGGLILSLHHARVDLPALDGTPSLCTYGQDTGKHRRPFGPTGQLYETTYGNVETDYVQVMIRNTLYEVMKKSGVENGGVGPVEYGMESTTCRVVCAAVFCVAICSEVFSMDTMRRFLWYSPTIHVLFPYRVFPSGWLLTFEPFNPEDEEHHGQWIEFDELAKGERARELFPMIGKSSLDHISFKCNGVTDWWKLCSWLMLAGRFCVVVFTSWNGLFFLMNTGGITDLILNSLALIFIVDLDRLMFTTLARGITKDIMHRLQPLWVKPKTGVLARKLKETRKTEMQWGPCGCSLCWLFLTFNITTIVLILVTWAGHRAYFHQHCEMQVSPLNVTEWFSDAYFQGQTRWLGGWEFVFGAWVSLPTVDKYSDNATCVPAAHQLSSNNISKPQGCGLPVPWTGMTNL